MDFLTYFKLRSARKRLAAAANHASTVRKMQRDLVAAAEDEALRAEIERARRLARRSTDLSALAQGLEGLAAAIGEGSPWRPLHPHAAAENFEVAIVAVAVAMAFRCYFFQPFKIPTGSMQPTLYGIRTVSDYKPGPWDRLPLKCVKWAATGDWYREIRVQQGGSVLPVNQTLKPGYVSFRVAGRHYHVPAEAVVDRGYLNAKALRDVRPDGTIPSGGVLWSGIVKAGDHVFVNRMAWNFRRPRRGDVMVFSTTGIAGLPQGTHYIKRMCGLPGETLSIHPPYLVVDGAKVESPESIGRIARRERITPADPPYAGYQPIGRQLPAEAPTPLYGEADAVTLGPGEYYALGDNTGNSRDSRFWGPVPAGKLLGPALVVYWPFTRLGIID